MEASRSSEGRRWFGAELRRLREGAGKTIEEVAERLECSLTKVSRIETGQVSPRPLDVREMLDLYGVTGARQDALLAMVREARQTGWWHPYADVIPDGYQFFIGLEDRASTIFDYQSFLIPGLVQTEEYMWAVMDESRVPPTVRQRRVELRLQRQLLLVGSKAPTLRIVLEESALYRTVGAEGVMYGQLRRLVEAAQRPNVTVQVISTKVGLHPAEGRAFTILGFPDPAEPRIVYIEHINESHLIEDVDKVGRYLWAFDSVCTAALSPEESVTLIAGLAEKLDDAT